MTLTAARAGLFAALLATLMLPAAPAGAQSVAMTGAMGSRALLVIDGKTVTAAAGQTVHGVKVISVSGSQAVVEVAGKRQTVELGAAQVNLGGKGLSSGSGRIVLTAGPGGHFRSLGQINGQTVEFMVDTGASMIGMSEQQAQGLGIDYKRGQAGTVQTANGVARAWMISLSRVRVGEVEIHNVDALVTPAGMPLVLLGNSFLSRFQMRRENDTLTLERRF
jgi:aspartyl protease family protein